MAELAAARNNALPYPVYGLAWTVGFPLLDADGDPVSPSSPDSEVSKNFDTYADCTNEATEVATSSGTCYLTLTAAEMTADVVMVRIQSTGAKTTILTLYPRKLPVLSTGTCQGSNDTGDIQLAAADSAVNDTYNGCLCVAVIDGTTEARIINDYVGSTKVGEVSPAWSTAQPDSNDTYTIYLPEGRQVPPANATHLDGGDLSADGPIPLLGIIDQGTAQSATSTTVVLRAAAAFADDTLIGAVVQVFGSTQGYWQTREITDNTLADDTVTVDAWTVTPSGTITYRVFGQPPAPTTPTPVDAVRINGSAPAAVRLDRACRAVTTVTVGAASTTTSVVTSAMDPAAVVTDQFKGLILAFDKDTTTAALRGQKTDITGSSSGGVLTVTELTTAPASGDTATIG
jgi:hypothetical protein